MNELLAYLNLFHSISEDDFERITSRFKSRSFRKNEFITRPGQVQREVYFVKEGVQMSYFDAENKSHVIAFTYAPNLCAIPESFSFQTPSKYSLIALSDSETDYLTYDDVNVLFVQSQQIERLFRRMAEAILAGMINRHMELHSLSIEERFKVFCQRSPHLLHMVPHKYIASYLNIDPTNFSKLYNKVRL